MAGTTERAGSGFGLDAGAGEAPWFMGQLATVKMGSDETQDHCALLELLTPAGGGRPTTSIATRMNRFASSRARSRSTSVTPPSKRKRDRSPSVLETSRTPSWSGRRPRLASCCSPSPATSTVSSPRRSARGGSVPAPASRRPTRHRCNLCHRRHVSGRDPRPTWTAAGAVNRTETTIPVKASRVRQRLRMTPE